MHNIRKYTGNPAERADQALLDLKNWIGDAVYDELKAYAVAVDRGAMESNYMHKVEFVRGIIEMAGVTGFPAAAFVERYMPNARTLMVQAANYADAMMED